MPGLWTIVSLVLIYLQLKHINYKSEDNFAEQQIAEKC